MTRNVCRNCGLEITSVMGVWRHEQHLFKDENGWVWTGDGGHYQSCDIAHAHKKPELKGKFAQPLTDSDRFNGIIDLYYGEI